VATIIKSLYPDCSTAVHITGVGVGRLSEMIVESLNLLRSEGTRGLNNFDMRELMRPLIGKRVIGEDVILLLLLLRFSSVVFSMVSHNLGVVELVPIYAVCLDIFNLLVFIVFWVLLVAGKAILNHAKEEHVVGATSEVTVEPYLVGIPGVGPVLRILVDCV
jgi:hypothetical protein